MGHRLTRSRSYRAALAAVWTLVLVSGLYVSDRLFFGPGPQAGWQDTAGVDAIPAEVGPVLIPAFLPSTVTWPPARVLYRTEEPSGWWLGMGAADDGGIRLWIGSGVDPAPQALGEVTACLRDAPREGCPAGWSALSTQVAGGQTLFVLTDLPPLVAERILAGLILVAGEP